MAWIELHQTLPQNKKTLRLKSILKISQAEAIGHLCMLWLWSVDNAPDGDLSEFYSEEIASISGWDKDPDEFLNALINSGFVDDNKTLHDWYDYAGRLIEKREANRTRMRNARADKNEDCALHVQNTCNARAGATVQYTTQPNSTVPNSTVPNQTYDVVVKGEKNILIDGSERTRVEIASVWGREPSTVEINRTVGLIESLNGEVTAESLKLLNIALKVCEDRNACNLAFLTGIYNNFRDRGIKTVKDYYDYEQGVKHG